MALEKEQHWSYAVPAAAAGGRIKTVSVGLDGTCTLFVGDGWRQVMVGTIAFYDEDGERCSTIYVASAPEAGRASFFAKMEREIARVRAAHPDARYVGVADGAHDLWSWLEDYSTWQVVDFWHASEYLAAAAPAMARGEGPQARWLEDACHRLKHESGAVEELIAGFGQALDALSAKSRHREALERAASYFGNHAERMKYAFFTSMGFPIGSGVTEAACKSVVKERLCASGMRWTREGAENTLTLRALTKSAGRWNQFWQKTAQFGFERISAPKRKR